jgi:hypothetical protein
VLQTTRRPTENEDSRPFPAPFDERNYTVEEAAKILLWSPNQVSKKFRHEPGVHDLALSDGAKKKRLLRKRRYSQLRIPHSVLVRVWNRTQIDNGGAA